MNGQILLIIYCGLFNDCLTKEYVLANYDYEAFEDKELVEKDVLQWLAFLKDKGIKNAKDYILYLKNEYTYLDATYISIMRDINRGALDISLVLDDYSICNVFLAIYIYKRCNEDEKISINSIQSTFGFGFNKSSRIIEILKELNLIGTERHLKIKHMLPKWQYKLTNVDYSELEKYHLPAAEIDDLVYCKLPIIEILPEDLELLLNDKKIARYYYGDVKDIKDIKINTVIENPQNEVGFVLLQGNSTLSVTMVSKYIQYFAAEKINLLSSFVIDESLLDNQYNVCFFSTINKD